MSAAEKVSNDLLAEGLHYDLAEACAKAGQVAEAIDWKATAQHDLTGQVFTDLHGYLKSQQRNSPETQVNTLANAARSIAYALNFFQVRKLEWGAKRGAAGR